MEKQGKAFARLYWYDDDDKIVYLDMLSVDQEERGKGLGTKLQEIRENIGRELGAIEACLWVKKNTWMYRWYKRRSYLDWKDHETENNSIWMKKIINYIEKYEEGEK